MKTKNLFLVILMFSLLTIGKKLNAQTLPPSMWFYNNMLFIGKDDNIWLVDETNFENPRYIGKYTINGNTNIIVKDNFLYADNYNDLVKIDLKQKKEVARLSNVFNVTAPTNAYLKRINYRPAGFVASGINFSQGGSLAKFAINGNYLYALNKTDIKTIQLSNDSQNQNQNTKFELVNTVEIPLSSGSQAETLISEGNRLLVGANDGMYIYSVENASLPNYQNKYDHIKSCDPVVINNNIAYITMHKGSECGDGENVLEVVDISNNEPERLKSISLEKPMGLGIVDNNNLLVCDDNEIILFDISNPSYSSEKTSFTGDAYDLIVFPNGNTILSLKDNSFANYKFNKNKNTFNYVSKIPLK